MILLFIAACNPLVYLNDNESLLIENKVTIKDRKATESRSLLKAELSLLFIQKPNTDFLFIDREWYYFKFESQSDTSKNGFFSEFIRNNIAQAPSIHNSELMDETAVAMQNYLRNRKGYYHATISTDAKIKNKEAKVKYFIYTGNQFTIHKLSYICEDAGLQNLISGIQENTVIPPGSPVEESKFNEEKNRIVRIIQDSGYPRFNSNYVQYSGDTIGIPFGMDVHFNILAPGPDQQHQKYTVGEIKVYTDHSIGNVPSGLKNQVKDSVDFYSVKEKFEVNPNTISKRIFIEEGELYVRSKELRTSQALSNLNAYRFVNLNPNIDQTVDTVINYNFLLTPIKNKKVFEGSADVYLANVRRRDSEDQFYGLGLNGDINYSTRNIFNNAEDWSYGANSFVEFNPFTKRGDRINTWGFTGKVGNSIPQVTDYLKVLWFANRIGLIPESRNISLNDNTNTDINLGLSYTFTSTIYSLLSGNLTYGYNYKPNSNNTIRFTQAELNYLRLNPDPLFQPILDQNPYLENSFKERFLTGFVFKDFAYLYTSPTNFSGFNWGLSYLFETSGLELSVLNTAYNFVSGADNTWKVPIGANGIEIAKYFKIDLEHRFSQKIVGRHSIAGKLRAGIADPFGGSEAVPFVRQFAVGGQNSIRGWQIRDLGPGGYNINEDPTVSIENTLPFQTGDFLLESSIEYRFPVVGFLNSAFFIDAGNVWSTSPDDERKDARLSKDFYKQIAVAAGVGFRLDFSYFLMRFDYAYKIRNPYTNDQGSYMNYSSFKLSNITDGNLSFGVNLPF